MLFYYAKESCCADDTALSPLMTTGEAISCGSNLDVSLGEKFVNDETARAKNSRPVLEEFGCPCPSLNLPQWEKVGPIEPQPAVRFRASAAS